MEREAGTHGVDRTASRSEIPTISDVLKCVTEKVLKLCRKFVKHRVKTREDKISAYLDVCAVIMKSYYGCNCGLYTLEKRIEHKATYQAVDLIVVGGAVYRVGASTGGVKWAIALFPVR